MTKKNKEPCRFCVVREEVDCISCVQHQWKALKNDFFRVFNKLHNEEKRMPIYVDEKYGPCSWNIVKLEVRGNTPMSRKMLKRLRKMMII